MAERQGQWNDKRTNVLRLVPNALKTGELATIKVEGIARPSEICDKKCTVKLMEVDKEGRKPRVPVATFEATIVKKGDGFVFTGAKRTDDGPTKLPSPETLTAANGALELPFQTTWKRPHLKLKLDGCGEEHLVIVEVGEQQREGMVYELALDLELSGSRKAHAFNDVSFLDCWDVLEHNCLEATKIFVDGHHGVFEREIHGTHYGARSFYAAYWNECLESNSHAMIFDSEMLEGQHGRQYLSFDSARLADEKRTAVQNHINDDLTLDPIDGKTFIFEVLERAYEESLASADWRYIRGQAKGAGLPKGMSDCEWEAIYFNPDTKNPMDWYDKGEEHAGSLVEQRTWQEHTWSAGVAKSDKVYYGAPLIDTLVDYRPNDCEYRKEEAVTAKSGDPSTLMGLPFAVLVAHGGKHFAVIRSGELCEVQASMGPQEKRLFETKRDFATTWNWHSGVILAPKGAW